MLSLKVSEQVYAGFSIPIFQSDMPKMEEMNEDISGFLLNERLRAKAENYFDWSTAHDLHKRGNSSILAVVNMFANAIVHLTRMEFESDIPSSHVGISADVWGSLTRAGGCKIHVELLSASLAGNLLCKMRGGDNDRACIPLSTTTNPRNGKVCEHSAKANS